MDLLKEFLDGNREQLKERGIPKDLAKEIAEKVEVFRGVGIYRPLRRYKNFRRFMWNYLKRSSFND